MQGEQGSSKSTTAKVLRSIIDPSSLPIRSLPKDEKLLAMSTNNTWILSCDNLSGLSNTMSDILCKMSTGGGISVRTLFTTKEETILKIKRPCILNGIDHIGRQSDFLDRSIVITLPNIKGESRIDERNFWANFEYQHANILGALCDSVSGALQDLPFVRLEKLPRMADFVLWITAAERALNWETGLFKEIYNESLNKTIDSSLESDPVGIAVLALMSNRKEWLATTTETYQELKTYSNKYDSSGETFPSLNKLKDRLRRLSPFLKAKGITYTNVPRSSRGARLKLTRDKEICRLF